MPPELAFSRFRQASLVEVPPIRKRRSARSGAAIIGVFAAGERLIFVIDHTFWPSASSPGRSSRQFLFLFIGLQWTSASHAILFLYTAPFFVALGAAFLLPLERLRPAQWVGLALSFVGVALALGTSTGIGPKALLGDLLTLLAGALWGGTTLIVKGTRLGLAPATKILLYQLFVSALFLIAAAWIAGESLPATLRARHQRPFTMVWVGLHLPRLVLALAPVSSRIVSSFSPLMGVPPAISSSATASISASSLR